MDLGIKLEDLGFAIEELDVRGDPIEVVTIGTILFHQDMPYKVVMIETSRKENTVTVTCRPLLLRDNVSLEDSMFDYSKPKLVVTFDN